ncbi:hypothetical protein GOA69_33140 [Sinorhizobium meliloti]|nr:hypothetical protein [Sinorhizobium meliloti]
MAIQRATGIDERLFPIDVHAGCAARVSRTMTQRCRVLGFLIAAATLSAFGAFAQTANCRVTHVDYHERRALQSVQDLFAAPDVLSSFPYVLLSYPYVAASSAQRRRGQSEAARITPDVVAQNPDVIVVHGSTFTGSANLRLVLGELIRNIARENRDIRGFLVYSSAPLDAADLLIDGPLHSKLVFMYAPIMNRFIPPDPSAKTLVDGVKQLCGA